MRRRVYINPEGDLEDKTDSPYLYDLDQGPDARMGICRTGALYDDALWAEYQAACAEANRLRGLVCRAMTNEPWDDVERKLAERSTEVLNRSWREGGRQDADGDNNEMERIAAHAIEHAQGCVKP